MKYLRLSVAIAVFTFNACKQDDTEPPVIENPINAIIAYSVEPQETDTSISSGLNTQFAFITENPSLRKDKLLIFLPGTLAQPGSYLKILQTASENGYYSIGIDYKNNQSIANFCGNTNDQDCDYNVLTEFFEGVDVSPNVIVPYSNSFTNRIIKMIQFLDNQVPSENWSRFLIDLNTIDWSKISLAGHSQGSAHTMYISKRVSLFRASFYSGPNGFELIDGNFPSWISQVGATDISKIFAFSNNNDNLYPWNYALDVWDEIGILGSEIDVDVSSDFSGSNQFTTSVIPPDTNGSFSPTHGSTTVDIVTPVKSDGRPLFEDVWKIMSFPD